MNKSICESRKLRHSRAQCSNQSLELSGACGESVWEKINMGVAKRMPTPYIAWFSGWTPADEGGCGPESMTEVERQKAKSAEAKFSPHSIPAIQRRRAELITPTVTSSVVSEGAHHRGFRLWFRNLRYPCVQEQITYGNRQRTNVVGRYPTSFNTSPHASRIWAKIWSYQHAHES